MPRTNAERRAEPFLTLVARVAMMMFNVGRAAWPWVADG